MPAREHSAFRPPDDPTAVIWRYIDLPKFVSFLQTSQLHLSRLSSLPDQFEGRLPEHVIRTIDKDYAVIERRLGRDPGPIPQFAKSIMEHVRNSIYVNCWCCQPDESESLWRLYNYPSGVAFKTTFTKLRDALPEECSIGQVRYLDYETESPSPDNLFNLAMHKRRFYDHEREVRVVHAIQPMSIEGSPPEYPCTPPFMTFTIGFAPIEAIVLSPYSPPWFLQLARDLCRRYGCSIPVCRSRMAD